MEHKPFRMAVVIVSFIAYIVILFFNLMASGFGKTLGIFLNTTQEISAKYDTDVTPAGWAFIIWGVIYAWQMIWFIYGLSTLCRAGSQEGYLYYSPQFMPLLLYVIFVLNNAINVGWLLLWDRQHLEVALVFLFFISFTLYVCLFLSFRALWKTSSELKKVDVLCVRILVQNGLGVYAAWTTIATLLNLAAVVQYRANASRDVAGTVSLAVLTVELVVYFTLDILLLDRWMRYFISPYFVVIWSLAGVLSKSWDPARRNPIWTLVLCITGGVLLIVRIVVMIYRYKYKPLNNKIDITVSKD